VSGSGAVVSSWSLLVAAIIAVVRQNFHLSSCAEFRSRLFARGGQIIDATVVAVPKQRNDRDENRGIKAGDLPEAWNAQPNKLAQKDCDARWTKKHGKSYFGYKNHLNVDARHKLIRRYEVTDASVHDSRAFDDLMDPTNTSRNVFADSAYRSVEIEEANQDRGLVSRIHQRAKRNHPLSNVQDEANRKRSQVRARIEHVFRSAANIARRSSGAHHWHSASKSENLTAKPRLQYPTHDYTRTERRRRIKMQDSVPQAAIAAPQIAGGCLPRSGPCQQSKFIEVPLRISLVTREPPVDDLEEVRWRASGDYKLLFEKDRQLKYPIS
jgi:IS5 family transposase